MKTSINIIRTERVDDIPLLLTQMKNMNIATLLDKHFHMHGNWQGLTLGQIVVVWLAYILSEGDHRLNAVQGWVAGILMTLTLCWKTLQPRELDFSDDRLGMVLDCLGGNDADWEEYEIEQNSSLIRVYDLTVNRIRIDSTTAKSYIDVTEDGLFQFGHSKEHRPDLPQLKINQSVLDPLGIPLTTTIVSGECADDPLYVPEIRKVQASIQKHGVHYVGDCKMAAINTRAYLAACGDYYLCPLSAVQMPAARMQAMLQPVWEGKQPLIPVYRPLEMESDKQEHIADGFSYSVTVEAEQEGKSVVWQEQHLVIHSLKHAKSQEKALETRLQKARTAIETLNLRGRGRKCLTEDEMHSAVEQILSRYKVSGLLTVEYILETQTAQKRAYAEHAAQILTVTKVSVCVSADVDAYASVVRNLGWRVFVCNDASLSLIEAVLAYRAEYIVERGFNRFRGKLLGLTPLFLSSTTRIKGLVRLLTIALRVLCLIEFKVREALQEQGEKLNGIYPGNPKRASAKPTTEMMLKVFRGITLTVITVNDKKQKYVSPLNAVQSRILELMGLPLAIYQELGIQSG